ncbi:hypothetical protein [Lachnoclostridium sp. MSJ-17]|uniref:hypothetical protein n=1 Tax=Lachnoclostridium sp. MSJ-17 TaxID=2841516 RepID=UPI001C122451|nr:hypothetical protein [Lachnoclostridium sp. MSJ-17]MBU5462946.1 hypothetical protein [Lachnoclostridium sp. MSJ-17]
MKKKNITILAVAAMAVLTASVFAACGEGDKNSEATTSPSSTSVQPTTAKGTQPKTTVPTTAGSEDYQDNNYNSAADQQGYNNSENSAYNSDVQSSAEDNANESSNSSPQSSEENNGDKGSDYPEIPGEGEIVIHGDPSYVGTD